MRPVAFVLTLYLAAGVLWEGLGGFRDQAHFGRILFPRPFRDKWFADRLAVHGSRWCPA